MGLFTKKHQGQQKIHKSATTDEETFLVKVYKNDTFCMFPHTLQEINRLDFQHFLLKHAFQANYLAPIANPTNILDVACGSGRWMLEMASTFPKASMIGIDLAPPTKEDTSVNFPPTCKFMAANVINGLPFADQSFDFVHQRLLVMSLASVYWPAEIHELIRVTRRGGWVELVEVDLDLHNLGPIGKRIGAWIKLIGDQQGLDGTIGRKIESFLRMTSLTHIKAHKVTIPIGSWGGRFGIMLAKDFTSAIQTIKPLVVAKNRIKAEEVDRTIDLWMQECDRNHCSYDFYIVYGQRP